VQYCGHAATDRQTDIHTQTRVTTIHFTSSTNHVECNHIDSKNCCNTAAP